MKSFKIIVNNKEIVLDLSCYFNQGGQALIYLKNNIIFKIYHDPKLLIPEMKIEELQVLSDLKNIIIPTSPIYKGHQRVGFIMRYVPDTEFLCKLFVGNFKSKHNITNQMVVDLIKVQQDTMQAVHDRGVVFGDYNEMNQLTDKGFKIPFHIDMDSVQTKNFKCNAIMESVRDRKLPFGTFNESSDWFSWAIITFQMYTGIHPFKGSHPKYKKKDWSKRMDDNISVFDKDVLVPKFVNYNVIPKNHLEWYKQVFVSGDRSIPPAPTGVANIKVIKNVYVDDRSDVLADILYKYNDKILDVVYRTGVYYVLTEKGLHYDDRLKISFNNGIDNGHILFTPTGDIVIATEYNKELLIFDSNKTQISKIVSSKYKVFNNCIYSIDENGLMQYSFECIGKVKCLPKIVSTINYNSSHIYDGVVLQGIFGKYSALVPFEYNKCTRINIAELNGCRMLDAKRIGHWLFVVYEKNGVISNITILFDSDFKSYTFKIDDHVDFRSINAIIKQNNMVVFNTDDNVLELFFDFKRGSKVIKNTPVHNDLELVDGKTTCFINGKELYSITMK